MTIGVSVIGIVGIWTVGEVVVVFATGVSLTVGAVGAVVVVVLATGVSLAVGAVGYHGLMEVFARKPIVAGHTNTINIGLIKRPRIGLIVALMT